MWEGDRVEMTRRVEIRGGVGERRKEGGKGKGKYRGRE
jgi:hypothetical protein